MKYLMFIFVNHVARAYRQFFLRNSCNSNLFTAICICTCLYQQDKEYKSQSSYSISLQYKHMMYKMIPTKSPMSNNANEDDGKLKVDFISRFLEKLL